MADPNLTESAWQRAKVDAAGVYQSTAFQLGGALVTAIFGALALIAQEGQPTTTQVAVPILAAAVAILLSVIGVFACQLAAAPVRQRDELREAVDDPTVESVNVELTLRNQWRIGDDLHKKVSGSSMGYSTADAKGARSGPLKSSKFSVNMSMRRPLGNSLRPRETSKGFRASFARGSTL